MDETDRHQLRIQVKKIRYAVEFLRGVFPAEAKNQKRFASHVEGLQEALGKLNDLATARALAISDLSHQTEEEAEADSLAEAERHARKLAENGPFWPSKADRGSGGWLLRPETRKARRRAKADYSA